MAREASWSAPGTGALERTSRTLVRGGALRFTSRLARNPKRCCAPHSKTWRRTPRAKVGAAALVWPDYWSPVVIRRRRGNEAQISPADTELIRVSSRRLLRDGWRAKRFGVRRAPALWNERRGCLFAGACCGSQAVSREIQSGAAPRTPKPRGERHAPKLRQERNICRTRLPENEASPSGGCYDIRSKQFMFSE